MTAMLVVAAKGGEAVKAGPIGLAVILLLCIACYFLFKSMSKHMRNVREGFPGDGAPTASTPVNGSAHPAVSLVKRGRTDIPGPPPGVPHQADE